MNQQTKWGPGHELALETHAYQKRPRSQLNTDNTSNTLSAPLLGDNPPKDATPPWAQELLTRLWYVQSQVRELGTVDERLVRLDERLSKLDERLTNIETDRWFARTIDRTGYRPAPIEWEPIPGTWGKERRPRSPYRR